MTDARYEELMVKVVDHTATPAEREELMTFLAANPDRRRDFEAQRALKALTDGWVTRLEHDLALDDHEASTGWRVESAAGWLLLLGATIALTAGATWEIWIDPEVPLWLQAGWSMGLAGVVVLLVAVIRWRMRVSAADPYSEVIR